VEHVGGRRRTIGKVGGLLMRSGDAGMICRSVTASTRACTCGSCGGRGRACGSASSPNFVTDQKNQYLMIGSTMGGRTNKRPASRKRGAEDPAPGACARWTEHHNPPARCGRRAAGGLPHHAGTGAGIRPGDQLAGRTTSRSRHSGTKARTRDPSPRCAAWVPLPSFSTSSKLITAL